jgi:hypothetical protein
LITKPNQGIHCWRNWFSCGMLNNFTCFPHLCVWQLIDIILSKDGVPTIANIIIANLSSVDLLPWTTLTLRFTTSKVVHIKERTYKERVATKNKFMPLGIEVFGCLHKQVDTFLQVSSFNTWRMKGSQGPPLFGPNHVLYTRSFNYIIKDARHLYSKSCHSGRVGHIPTSTYWLTPYPSPTIEDGLPSCLVLAFGFCPFFIHLLVSLEQNWPSLNQSFT